MSDNIDPKLSSMAVGAILNGEHYDIRRMAMEFSVRSGNSISDANMIVQRADTIFNYLLSGTVPGVSEEERKSSFKKRGI